MTFAGLGLSGPAFFLGRRAWIIAFAIFFIMSVMLFPLIPALCVEETGTGAFRTFFAPETDQEFYIEFTHSVNRTNVREYYKIQDGIILLTRAEYISFGVGMPETPERPGSSLSVKNGVLHLDDINQPLPSFVYRVGIIAEHTLHLNNRTIPLKSIAPPQTALRFEYRRVSAYNYLRRLDRSE